MKANQAFRNLEECEVDVGSSFVSHAQPALWMQPADCSFDNPADFNEANAVFSISFCKVRLDAQPPQDESRRFGVIGAVCEQLFRSRARRPRLPLHGRYDDDQWQQLHYVRNVRSGNTHGQRNPSTIHQEMMFCSRASSVGRIGAGRLATADPTNTAGINGRMRPIDLVGGTQFRQQDRDELVPDTGLLPIPQTTGSLC